MEGIMMMGKRDHQAHKSSLWDETAQLKRAFEAIREPRAIDTALSFFEEPYDQRYRFYGEKKDVMESLIKQAITLYPEANQFYDRILNIFINYGKTSDRDILQLCREFFEKTGTLTKAYDTVFHLQGLHQIQKNQLLSLALNAETIDFIINEIESGRVKPEDIVRFAEEAYHHTRNTNYAPGAKELKEQLEQRLNITFDDAQLLARQDKRRQYEQDSFDLLFDEPAFKAEADRFWKALGKDAASWSDIWEFANSKEYHLDEYFPRSVTTIIGELSRDTGYITKADADAFMNSGISFEIERIDSIYNLLKNSGLKATDEQIAYLEDWANRTAARLDIKRSIDEHGRFNGLSLMIWYFVKNQHIKLPDDKLLDFTLFYDFIQGDIESWYTPMVEQVGEEAFNARIIENLKSGLKVEHVWSLNAEYAIKKGLKESFDAIKSDLVRINEVTSVKENIAKLYLESTNDHGGLFEVLQQLSPQDFRWELVDLLFNGLKEKIHAYLLEILHSDTSKEYKIAAAKRLTALADEEGFNYYADHGFNNPDVAYRDDLWLSYLTGLKTLNFLPRLTALLEQSLRPENMNDVFRRYDGKVLEALFNMGLQSEKT
ncbi:hypothetical protein ACRQ5D_31250 [Mucilaginibacter sp. P25]|uniref:hypothetical protein n=1 Tax=Mucilaginibacter sp. P25 TaxID=3423945 RepID=UPI003D79D46F